MPAWPLWGATRSENQSSHPFDFHGMPHGTPGQAGQVAQGRLWPAEKVRLSNRTPDSRLKSAISFRADFSSFGNLPVLSTYRFLLLNKYLF